MTAMKLPCVIVLAGLASLTSAGALDPHAALLAAAKKGDFSAAEKWIGQGAAVDARDESGWTPLIFAAQRGDFAMVKLLVSKGADVNAQTTTTIGSRVLAFSTEGRDLKLMEFLLDHGARINDRGRNGTTALYQAATQAQEDVVRFLLEKGADPNQLALRNERGNVFTPAFGAALNGHLKITELLLDKGGRLERRNNRGNTVLMEAARVPYPEVIRLLIARGANVNATGPQGHTAFIFAAYNGQVEAIKLLLAAGADPRAQATDAVYPNDGWTYGAEKLARQQGHPEALALILEAQKRAGRPAKPEQ